MPRIEALEYPKRSTPCEICKRFGRHVPATHRVWARYVALVEGRSSTEVGWSHEAWACAWHARVEAALLEKAERAIQRAPLTSPASS
jgi:hypothetical protein